MVRIARKEECVDGAMQVIANAVTVEQLRQAQAVVLPLRFAMSLEPTAEVTGLSVGWVSKQRNRFIQVEAVGDGTTVARGGRRRQNFTPQQEAAVLKPLLPPYAHALDPARHLWDEPQEKCFHNKVFISLGAPEDNMEVGCWSWKTHPNWFRQLPTDLGLLMFY